MSTLDAKAKPKISIGSKVVWGVLVFSIVTGGLAYLRYRSSEQQILKSVLEFRRLGQNSTVEQCVDHVVDWSKRCGAMWSMCESSAPRLMQVCLFARDRLAYCRDLKVNTSDTRFGYQQCRARGATKGQRKKACASAYRAIDGYCKRIKRRQRIARGGRGRR